MYRVFYQTLFASCLSIFVAVNISGCILNRTESIDDRKVDAGSDYSSNSEIGKGDDQETDEKTDEKSADDLDNDDFDDRDVITDDDDAESGDGINDEMKITYTNGVQKLIGDSCLSCHNGKEKPNLNSYENAKQNAANSLKEIKAGRMPPSSALSGNDKTLFDNWVTTGMPE